MDQRTIAALALIAGLGLGACAVKSYPREVTAKEKMDTNVAYGVDTAGAYIYSAVRFGPDYDLERQKVHVDYSYYLDPELQANPRSFYPEVGAPPDVEKVKVIRDDDKVEVTLIKWKSLYTPRNPAFAPMYATYVENHSAWGVYVRSKRGARAGLVISHGWTGPEVEKTWEAERMLEYAELGYDSVLIQQPYHGYRAPADSVFSGEYFLSGEIARINEAMCQTVTDVRSMVMWLRERHEVVGIKGGSLGGITTLQTAAVEDRIDFAIAWVPPSSLGDIPEDTKLAPAVVEGMRASGLDQETVRKVLYVSSPANFTPAIDKDDILLIAGMGDNFVPADQPAKVWAAWGEPRIYWFAGGHAINFELDECKAREREFLKDHLAR